MCVARISPVRVRYWWYFGVFALCLCVVRIFSCSRLALVVVWCVRIVFVCSTHFFPVRVRYLVVV